MMKTDLLQHQLFQRFGLTALKHTSSGMLPVPYHIYDGHATFIGGTALLEPVRDLLAAETVYAVETSDGRALMGIWVIDATDASLGAHRELQFSIVVSRSRLPTVVHHPLIMLSLLQFDPDVRLFCHGLWNNTEPVVAYNREVLFLDAHLMTGTIVRETQRHEKRFAFADPSGSLIFGGTVEEAARTSVNAVVPLLRLMGLSKFVRAARAPWLASQVVNPIGLLPVNAEAQAYIVNDRQVLQLFDPTTDRLEFADPIYRAVQFRGQFVQHMYGFKFVYLNIHNAGDTLYKPTPSSTLR
jgi:hypothetical protein